MTLRPIKKNPSQFQSETSRFSSCFIPSVFHDFKMLCEWIIYYSFLQLERKNWPPNQNWAEVFLWLVQRPTFADSTWTPTYRRVKTYFIPGWSCVFRFFQSLQTLVSCSLLGPTSPLAFAESVLGTMDQSARLLQNKEHLWRMWSLIVIPLTDTITQVGGAGEGPVWVMMVSVNTVDKLDYFCSKEWARGWMTFDLWFVKN